MKLPPPVRVPSGQPIVWVTWPGRCWVGCTSHSSLMPMPYFCGSRPAASPKRAMISFASEPRAPSAMNTYLPVISMPGWKSGFFSPLRPIPATPATTPAIEPSGRATSVRCREARIDLDAEALGLLRQPAAQIAERGCVLSVVVHEPRHEDVRKADRARRSEHVEAVFRHGGLERRASLPPVGDEFAEGERVDHRAGQDVGADLRSLLQDADADLAARRRRQAA